MTDEINSPLDQFQLIREREKSLSVWENCGSTLRVQENQNRIGVLLIHGFGASPYEMKGLEEYLFNEGFSVYSARLAGHATNMKDFSNSSLGSWLNSAEEAYTVISEVSSSTFIIGQSLGAAISLILGSKVIPAGIVSLSCILKFMDKKIRLTSFPILRLLFPYVSINVQDSDIGYVYDKRPTKTILELLKTRDRMVETLPKLRSPLLITHSEDDSTIDPKSAKIIQNKAGSEVKEILMFNEGGHRLTLMPGSNRDLLFKKIVSFFKEYS